MGLEVVVRPIVMPNIRPVIAQRIAPPDDPTKGICSMGGGGGGTFIGISESYSTNISRQHPHHETKRQVDVERVYQKTGGGGAGLRAGVKDDGGGTINRDNYVDVERMKKLRAEAKDSGAYSTLRTIFQEPEPRDNVEVIETNKTIKSEG
jgi:hypothetical protein